MPLTIPAFVQYQSPLVPLRGLWNHAPQEGDQYVNVTLDWLVSPPGSAVQFSLSGNSPVSLSQIAALYVDNGRSGSDVSFVFPDSGFELVVPAHAQGLFPVLTNALMFYAIANNAVLGDETIFQILNSNPPPIQIALSGAQNHASVSGINVVNGSTPIIAAGVNGTVNVIAVEGTLSGGAAPPIQIAQLSLQDGTGRLIWTAAPTVVADGDNSFSYHVAGLSVRFVNGLNFVIGGATVASGGVYPNVYYSTP